jgi:hypothetical protein
MTATRHTDDHQLDVNKEAETGMPCTELSTRRTQRHMHACMHQGLGAYKIDIESRQKYTKRSAA